MEESAKQTIAVVILKPAGPLDGVPEKLESMLADIDAEPVVAAVAFPLLDTLTLLESVKCGLVETVAFILPEAFETFAPPCNRRRPASGE